MPYPSNSKYHFQSKTNLKERNITNFKFCHPHLRLNSKLASKLGKLNSDLILTSPKSLICHFCVSLFTFSVNFPLRFSVLFFRSWRQIIPGIQFWTHRKIREILTSGLFSSIFCFYFSFFFFCCSLSHYYFSTPFKTQKIRKFFNTKKIRKTKERFY